MFASFIIAFAFSFGNPGAAMAWLAARLAVFRFVIRTLFARLVLAALLVVGTEAAIEGLLDAIIQRIQMLLGTRDHFDEAQFWEAVRDGTISGVISAVLGPAFGGFGHVLARRHLPSVNRGVDTPAPAPTPPTPTPTRWQSVRANSAEFVAGVSGEVVIEVVAEGTVSAVHGEGFDVSGGTATSGSISGALELGAESAGSASNT